MRFRNSDLLSDSIVDIQPSGFQTEMKNEESINTSLGGQKDKWKTLVQNAEKSIAKDLIAKESISRQLNFHVPSETTKERPVISLFSKMQLINSNRSQKQNPSAISSFHLQQLPVEVAIQNSPPSIISSSFIVNGNSNVRKPNPTALAPTQYKVKPSPTENHQNDSGASHSDDNFNPQNITNKIAAIRNHAEDVTPYKPFLIPQPHRLPPSNRRLVTNDVKNSRSALENEFQSQKVLFTTPSAVSRPIINIMNNVVLDDSLNCYKSSPIVMNSSTEKSQQKTLNYQPVERMNSVKAHDVSDTNEAIPIDNLVIEGDEIEETNKVIRINGKDFFVHKKIGQGGSSSVYLAEHKDRRLECALKVCRRIDDSFTRFPNLMTFKFVLLGCRLTRRSSTRRRLYQRSQNTSQSTKQRKCHSSL